jgi:ferredoxin
MLRKVGVVIAVTLVLLPIGGPGFLPHFGLTHAAGTGGVANLPHPLPGFPESAALLVVCLGALGIAARYLVTYGPCPVQVNQEEPFVAEGGNTLLEALYRQRLFIPSACGGQGTCGFCKVTVHDGGGPVLPTELPYLTKAEIAAHLRLAPERGGEDTRR